MKKYIAAAWILAAIATGCGTGSGDEPGTRGSAIIGGTKDTGHESVAMVLNSSLLGCSATLIAEDVLLTAAHCTTFLSSSAGPIFAWAGTDYLADEKDWERGVVS